MADDASQPSLRPPSTLDASDLPIALMGRTRCLRSANMPLRAPPVWLGAAAYSKSAWPMVGRICSSDRLRAGNDLFLLSAKLVASEGERPVRIGVHFGELCDVLYAVKEESLSKVARMGRRSTDEAFVNWRAKRPLTPVFLVSAGNRLFHFLPLLRADLHDAFIHFDDVDDAEHRAALAGQQGNAQPRTPQLSAVRSPRSHLAELAEYVLVQLAPQLAAAHRARVAHGDIKAENVFVTDDGDTFLGDFGFAPKLELAANNGTYLAKGHHGTEGLNPPELYFGAIFGRPGSEQSERRAHGYDALAADVWAFGAMLLSLLTPEKLYPNLWFLTSHWCMSPAVARDKFMAQSAAAWDGHALAHEDLTSSTWRLGPRMTASAAYSLRARDQDYLLQGKVPPCSPSVVRETIRQQVVEQYTGLDEVVPSWSQLLRQMLHLDPASRPTADDIERFVQTCEQTADPARPKRARALLCTVPALYATGCALRFEFDDLFGSARALRHRDRLFGDSVSAWHQLAVPSAPPRALSLPAVSR